MRVLHDLVILAIMEKHETVNGAEETGKVATMRLPSMAHDR